LLLIRRRPAVTHSLHSPRVREAVLPGQRRLIDQAVRSVLDGTSVLVRGEPGVGTTWIATGVVDALDRGRFHVMALRATPGAQAIPLAPFLTSVDVAADFGAGTERPSDLFGRLRTTIDHQAAGRKVVFDIDAIDLLDETSLVFVHQATVDGRAQLVATMHHGRTNLPALVDLERRGDLEVIDVTPFSREHADQAAEALAGVTLDAQTKVRLWRWCRGNALFIAEVLNAARERGLLDAPGPVTIDPLPIAAPNLETVVADRLRRLDPADRRVLTHLAFAEPCGPAELASVADGIRLAELEARNLVRADVDGARLRLRLTHPLYGEVIRAVTGPLQQRQILVGLAGDLLATGARRRSDVVPLARFAVDGGADIATDVLVQATSVAYHAGDLPLSERIGRRAYERTGDFTTGWNVLNCLLLLGDPAGAAQLLAQLTAQADRPTHRLATAAGRAHHHFWLGADDRAATRAIAAGLMTDPVDGVDDVAPTFTRGELITVQAGLHAAAGRPEAALAAATPELSAADDQATIRATCAAAAAYRIIGRPESALAMMDRAETIFDRIGPKGISLSPRYLRGERSLALVYLGRLDEAGAVAASIRNDTISDAYQALSWWTIAFGEAIAGRPVTGLQALEQADAHLASTDRLGIAVRWSMALDALMRSSTDDVVGAETALARFDADEHPARAFDLLAEIARSRVLARRQFPEEARDAMRREMARCKARGSISDEIFCGYELVRLGRSSEVSARLAELTKTTEGPLYRLIADQAKAMVTSDHRTLGAASNELSTLGFVGFAADAATWAAQAATARGDGRSARRWRARAIMLRGRSEALPHAAIQAEPADPLTTREREIATMAAAGLASKEIAARLYISTRTVDNHLAKAYRKLGVNTRSDLATFLDGAVGPL